MRFTNAGTFTTPPSSVALLAANFPVTGTNSYILVAAGLSGTVTIGAMQEPIALSITGIRIIHSAIDESGMSGNVTATSLMLR